MAGFTQQASPTGEPATGHKDTDLQTEGTPGTRRTVPAAAV